MPTIFCENINRKIPALNGGATLHDALLTEGVRVFKGMKNYCPFTLVCHGRGWCGNCKIEVVSGENNLNPLTGKELKQLGPDPGNRRLACQCVVQGDVTVRVRP